MGGLKNNNDGGLPIELDNNNVDVLLEQVIQKASNEPQLRRSARPRQPFIRDSPHEYMLVIGGHMRRKVSGYEPCMNR